MVPEKLLWKIYAGVIGAVATIAAQRLVKLGWKVATGDDPPQPTDPETPVVQAISWALASGIGVGVTQILTQRVLAKRWAVEMGGDTPDPGKVKLKI